MSDYKNRGIFFKNDYKKDNDKLPDYKGKIDVEGKEYELAGWVRDGAKGKFISLSISEPYKKEEPAKEPAKVDDDVEDGLPF